MTTPLVTIAIPTLDRLGYLKEAVASALAQSYTNVEVLVGIDGPSKEVEEWVRGVAAREPRVRFQRNARRLGLAGNWNALADAARGELLVIIGDDDRLLPDFAGRLAGAIDADAAVAFSNHHVIDAHGRRLEAEGERCTQVYGRRLLPAGTVSDAAAAVWRNSVPMSAAMLRTADVRRLRFKEDLNTPELELFVRLAHEGARFVFVPDYLAEYRTHPRSATTAGLSSERLARYLLAAPVAPGVEKYKRLLLSPMLVDAVGRCLQQGERELAQSFLKSDYYPRPRWMLKDVLTGGVQRLCAALPAPVGCTLYRAARRAKTEVESSLRGATAAGRRRREA
jgi:glycosyltransferase involved in cell wall biosynthesis